MSKNNIFFTNRLKAEVVLQWIRTFTERFGRITWEYFFDLVMFRPVDNDVEKYFCRGWNNQDLDGAFIHRDLEGYYIKFPEDRKFTYDELKELKTLLNENAERRAAVSKVLGISFYDVPFFEDDETFLKKRLLASAIEKHNKKKEGTE